MKTKYKSVVQQELWRLQGLESKSDQDPDSPSTSNSVPASESNKTKPVSTFEDDALYLMYAAIAGSVLGFCVCYLVATWS